MPLFVHNNREVEFFYSLAIIESNLLLRARCGVKRTGHLTPQTELASR